jgi:hypothetical protein
MNNEKRSVRIGGKAGIMLLHLGFQIYEFGNAIAGRCLFGN